MTIYPRIVEGIRKGDLEKLRLVQWSDSVFEHLDSEGNYCDYHIDNLVSIRSIDEDHVYLDIIISTDQDNRGTPFVSISTDYEGIDGFYDVRSLEEIQESREFHFQKYLVYKALEDHFLSRSWDYGDSEPLEITHVHALDPFHEMKTLEFKKSDRSDDDWSMFVDKKFKRKITWEEMIRRFGPVTEVNPND